MLFLFSHTIDGLTGAVFVLLSPVPASSSPDTIDVDTVDNEHWKLSVTPKKSSMVLQVGALELQLKEAREATTRVEASLQEYSYVFLIFILTSG